MTEHSPSHQSLIKKSVFTILLLLLILLLVEGISAVGIVYLRKKKNQEYRPAIKNKLTSLQKENLLKLINHEEKYVTHSPILGWTIKPNGTADLYQANSQGIRADSDYSAYPASDKIRIATFGDSFVHCDEVKNEETWQVHLDSFDRHLETINFGVGGYGTDQAYLRYLEDGRKFHPDIVLIGFMTENPIRNLNTFRPFYLAATGMPLSKPRFQLAGDHIRLINNPLNSLNEYQKLLNNESKVLLELSKNDYFYNYHYAEHPMDFFLAVRLTKILRYIYLKPKEKIFNKLEYNTNSEVYTVTAAIVEEFYNSVKNDGATPVLVFIPNSGDFGRLKDHQAKNYKPFMDRMDRKGIKYIDFTADLLNDILTDEHPESFFAPDYHFSSKGNKYVAKYIYQYLKENHYLDRPKTPPASP
ncbi:MAG: hypothetical protein AB7S78_09625 [Candidatus Omnitrophota bacterium]